MSSIDNRVVKISMENGQFTSAANSMMTTLKNLGESLKLTDGSKGLDDISKKAKGVDMSSLASGVEEVKSRFSALDIVGVTALVNIANSAVNAGKNMLKSLTVDPIMQGFEEYETKMGAITTIMTNTAHAGTTMDQVTSVLGELNAYADKTIYNFAEMTKNIGTFTAAGVDLETSATAIKGIANLAAGSGSTSQQASTAMYQLSQALAAGTLKLQDWNSVVNAGMGGKLFQNALEKTAESLGQGRNMAVSFRESLESGWITTEVLTKTLEQFAADESLLKAATQVKTYTQLIDTMKESVQSGWSQSWEFIIGDKDEAAEFFTAVSDGFNSIIEPMTTYRNDALKLWAEEGGREAAIKGLANAAKALGSVFGPIYESFKKILDPWNGERLIDLSKGFEKMTSSIKMTDKTSELLSKTADGVFSAFSIGGKVIAALLAGFGSLISSLSPLIEGFLSITASIGDYITNLNEGLEATNFMGSAMEMLRNGISGAATYIGNSLKKIADGISSIKDIDLSGLEAFGEKIADSFTPTEAVSNMVIGAIDGIKWALGQITPALTEFGSKVLDVMQKVSQSIIDVLGGKGNALNNIVSGGLLAAIALGINKIHKFFTDFESDFGGIRGLVDSIDELFDGLKGSLESFQNGIKAGTIKNIATAIALLAASLLVISMIDSGKLVSSLTSIGVMMGELIGAMVLLDKMGGGARVGVSVIAFSSAILILSNALQNTENISWENTAKGLLSIASMMGIMVAASKLMSESTLGMTKTAAAMIVLSGAISLMGSAMEQIGGIDANVIKTGLLGIAGIMAEMITFTKLIGNPSGLMSTATSMVILSSALLIIGNAINMIGSIDIGVLKTGIVAIASSIGTLGIAMQLIPNSASAKATGILIISAALLVLTQTLKAMGSMDWTTIGTGLAVLGSSLLILGVAMTAMSGTLAGSAALLVMAGALAILTPSLMLLGTMSLASIGTSLLVIAGAFTIFGAAGMLLAPVAPVLLVLGTAITLLGVACLSVGVGISAFAAGLAILSVSGAAGAAALVATVNTIIGVVPLIAQTLATALVEMINVFLENAGTLAKALSTFVITAVTALNDALPPIIQLVKNILMSVLNLLIETTPTIVKAVVTVVMSIITALTENIPKIAGLVTTSLLELLATVLNSLAESIGPISQAIVNIIVAILNSIGSGIPQIVTAIFDMIIQMIDGLAVAVETKMPEVRAAIQRLVTAIITEFGSAVKDAVNVGGNIIDGLKRGISNGIGAVMEAARNVASRALEAAKEFLGIHSPSREFAALGMYSSEGLAQGISNYSGLVEDSATSVADTALSSMRDALNSVDSLMNSDMSSNPVIKPVIDLTEIQNGVKDVNGLLETDTMGINCAINNTPKISPRTNSASDVTQGANASTANASSISFVQNNYSPKELSRLEIYRQTKNQFSMLKGVLT